MNFKEKLLDYYNLNAESFKELTKPIEEVILLDAKNIEGMSSITSRIFKAIQNKEKILIYGDYDCDGVSATTIMVKTFEKLNYPVSYYIPIRYTDAYGLNVANVEKIKKANFSLIIAVDNGISQHDAINKANELGIDVIVVDHHEIPSEPVKAYGVIHPIVSHISNIYGSGGYMALFLSAALLDYYDDYLVTIAGLSVISDMMELKGYNRDVVRLAIANLNKHRYKPLVYLMDNPVVNEYSFGLDISPKINAIGRLIEDKNINLLVRYLIAEDENEIFKISCWIKKNNDLRKELVKEAVDALPLDKMDGDGIVLKIDAKEGLLGLIANRLLGQYNKPAVIFTEDSNDKNFLKGSVRSKSGFNIQEAFDHLKKYLVCGGGHALSGGLTIKAADFDDFKRDFNEYAKQHPINELESKIIDLNLTDVTFDNYEILREFAPFGIGFKEPTFSIKNLPTKSLSFISGGKHLSTQLSINTKLLGFNMPEEEIKSHLFIDLYGSFNISLFRNKPNLDFKISDFITKDN